MAVHTMRGIAVRTTVYCVTHGEGWLAIRRHAQQRLSPRVFVHRKEGYD